MEVGRGSLSVFTGCSNSGRLISLADAKNAGRPSSAGMPTNASILPIALRLPNTDWHRAWELAMLANQRCCSALGIAERISSRCWSDASGGISTFRNLCSGRKTVGAVPLSGRASNTCGSPAKASRLYAANVRCSVRREQSVVMGSSLSAGNCSVAARARGIHRLPKRLQLGSLAPLLVDGPEPDPKCHRFLRDGARRSTKSLCGLRSRESVFRKDPKILDIFLGPST